MTGSAAIIAAAMSGAGAPPPNPVYWINLRGSAAGPTSFVGDGPNSTYMATGDTWDVVAHTGVARGVFPNLGYRSTSGLADQSGFGAFEHTAGRATFTAGGQLANIELPEAGMWNVWALMGHQTADLTSGVRVYKGDDFNADITPSGVTATSAKLTNQYTDLNGVVHLSEAAFLADALPVVMDFSTGSRVLSFGKHPSARLDVTAVGVQKVP